jgi:hypothetical protein
MEDEEEGNFVKQEPEASVENTEKPATEGQHFKYIDAASIKNQSTFTSQVVIIHQTKIFGAITMSIIFQFPYNVITFSKDLLLPYNI